MTHKFTKEELEKAQRLSPLAPVYKVNPTTVVKTGRIVRMSEAEAMRFVLQNTTVPVPQVHEAYRDPDTEHVVIVMDFVEGQSLDEAWETYSNTERESVVDQLKDYMSQLRACKGQYIGCVDGTACQDQWFYSEEEQYGPYNTEEAFNDEIIALMKKHGGPYTFVDWRCSVWSNIMKDHEFVLTHNDLDPRNILVQGSKVVAILDWEFAGYYPEYWEYCKAVSCPDWEHPWSESRVVDQIMKPYFKEISAFWNAGDIIH